MGDLKTSIILDLSGNLQNRARQMTGSLNQLGRQGSASMRLLGRGVALAGRGLDRMGNRYMALITGAAGVGAARQVANLENRFTRLGIQANRSTEDMDALKKKIFETAKAPEIRVDPGQITSAIEEIIEKTGDLKFAEANIRNIGLALQATGADGAAIGGILAEFQKMGLSGRQAFEALDILTVQGKEGAFTLQNLAALGPRVVTAYTAMGRTGVPAIREMGAALQVIRQGTGSSEMAATAFEALLRTLGDADKLKLLQRGGITVFEPGSTTTMRALPAIMEDIIKKTNGSKIALSKVFDAEAIRAFNAAAGEFQRTGKVESLQRFYQVQADGSTITRDSIRGAKTFNAALTNLYTVWQQFADNELTEPIKRLTEYLDGLKPGTVERWLEMGKNIAMITGGLIVARKMFTGGQAVMGMFGKGGKGGAGVPGMGGAGVVPVYVVNKQMSMLNDGSGFGTGLGGGNQPIKKSGAAIAGAARKVGTATVVAPAAYAVGTILQEINGAIVDKITGGRYSGAGWMGDAMFDFTHTDDGRWRVEALMEALLNKKNEPAELKIAIESDGRPRVTSMKPGSNLDMDVDAGRTMVTP